MNVLFEIIGTTVIGSLLIIALLTSLFMVSDSNFTLGRSLAVQKQAATIADILKADLSAAGIGVPDSASVILAADSSQVLFLADIDRNGVPDSVHYFTEPAVDIQGKVMTLLKRRAGSDAGNDAVLGKAVIKFTYYDAAGNETSIPGDIRSVETSLRVEDYFEYRGGFTRNFLNWRQFLKNVKK